MEIPKTTMIFIEHEEKLSPLQVERLKAGLPVRIRILYENQVDLRLKLVQPISLIK